MYQMSDIVVDENLNLEVRVSEQFKIFVCSNKEPLMDFKQDQVCSDFYIRKITRSFHY